MNYSGYFTDKNGNKYYPEALEASAAPPWVLYTKGNLDLLKRRKFAVVPASVSRFIPIGGYIVPDREDCPAEVAGATAASSREKPP